MKFTKYLPEFGWQPIIFTPENPYFGILDHSLEKDVPEQAEILRFPIWEPYSIFDRITGVKEGEVSRKQGITDHEKKGKGIISEISKWLRGNLFIPDPRVFWVRPSVKFLTDFVKQHSPDFIVTTGPPHSVHLIGLKLKKKTGVKWIADFRDPWSRWDMLANFRTSRLALSQIKRLEKMVVLNSDITMTVSQSWAKDLYGDYNKDISVITNGYDSDEFSIGTKKKLNNQQNHKTNFVISHSGLINNFRNPASFWEALRALCLENLELAQSLKIVFCGMVDKSILATISKDPVLADKFIFRGYLSHEEVLDIYKESAVLLLLLNRSKNAEGHLPGKLFEYLAAKRNILAMGTTSGDAGQIILNTKAGAICEYDDVNAIKNALSSFFSDFKNGKFPASQSVEAYSRMNLTKQLVELMENYEGSI